MFLRILACLLACFLTLKPGLASDDQAPNIVLLLADDLGWGDVGYHGGNIDTPNIDRLAKDGVRLENFHVCPLCSPTRAGLMTGRWPIRFGMGESVITPWRPWGMSLEEHTLANMLGKAGFQQRGVIGKWHLGHFREAYLPLNRGFTYQYGLYNGNFDYFTHKREGQLDWHRNHETCRDSGYATDLIGREAAAFIERSSREEPFFLYVPFNAPHTPLQAKEADIAKYRDRIEEKKQQIYAAMVDSMDQAIGEILAAIDAQGVRDNTVVWFMSDNGALSRIGSNGNWRSSKGNVYEGGVRVPAVVHWPRGNVTGGGKCDAMMGLVDVYPTLKHIAGSKAEDPNPIDGINVLDAIRGQQTLPDRLWYSYIAQGSADKLAVCDGTWKLVVLGGSVLDVPLDAVANDTVPENMTIELFNLIEDPRESTNLARHELDITQRLLKALHEHRHLKIEGIPSFREGREGFVPPTDWKITDQPN